MCGGSRPRGSTTQTLTGAKRPLSGLRAGDALADLMRMSMRHGIRLPPSFALVGKTLAQADSIARALDRSSTRSRSCWRRLTLSSYAFTQLGPLARLPRRVGQIADRLQTGTLRVGISPTGLEELEAIVRSAANRIGAAVIIAACSSLRR